MRHDILVVQRRPGHPFPGDRAALEEFGEQVGLLLEELLVVGQVVAEERERVDAGASSEDDFRPTAGDRVERRVALEDPDRIVRAQDGDRGPDVDPGRARGDRGEDDVRGRQREVIGVVFTDPDEVDADLVGEDALLDEVPDRLRMRQRTVVLVVGDVAERVEPEDEREWWRGHVDLSGFGANGPFERNPAQRSAEDRAATFEQPPGTQAVQPDGIETDPLDDPATTPTAAGSSPATPTARRSGEPSGRRSSSSSW